MKSNIKDNFDISSLQDGTIILVTTDKDGNRIYVKVLDSLKFVIYKIAEPSKELVDSKVIDAKGTDMTRLVGEITSYLVAIGVRCVIDHIKDIITGAII